jgi:Domain of unknown function (DUF4328)
MTKITADEPTDATSDAPGREFLPLRGLANILTVLLAVVVAFIWARLAIQLLSPGSVHYFADFHLDNAADITMLGLSILFVVWFYRARINAERHGYPQRRARAWAFWGWIVPIVNLWFPFQIMGDIWRAGLPAEQRGETAWLPALWWTCWLLSGLGIFGAGVTAVNSGSVPHIVADTNAPSLCFLAVAGAMLIAIIRTVSDGPVGSPLS